MIARGTPVTPFAPLVGAAIPPFGPPGGGPAPRRLGRDTGVDPKEAKVLRGPKTRNALFTPAAAAGLLAVGGTGAAPARPLSGRRHAQRYARWRAWPGIAGDGEECGVGRAMNAAEAYGDSGPGDSAVRSRWAVRGSGKWAEIGAIRGDLPVCPALAERAERRHWASWDGGTDSNGDLMAGGGRAPTPPVGPAAAEPSHADKDGGWTYGAGPAPTGSAANDFGKGCLQTGGEPAAAGGIFGGGLGSPQRCDAARRTRARHGDRIAGAGLDVGECPASSANVGGGPPCS